MTPKDNQEIAEWCGWRWARDSLEDGGDSYWCHPKQGTRDELPTYDSLNACAEFEAAAKERGLLRKYISKVWDATTDHTDVKYSSNPGDHMEAMWMATPDQRCGAILQVIQEAKA